MTSHLSQKYSDIQYSDVSVTSLQVSQFLSLQNKQTEFAEMCTSGKIGCLGGFTFVYSLSQYRMENFKLFGDMALFGLITIPELMNSKNCIFEAVADVLTAWHYVDIHQTAPEHQTAKCSAFIEVIKVLDDFNNLLHLRRPITLLTILEIVGVYLYFFHLVSNC